jgi:hypothetical protein
MSSWMPGHAASFRSWTSPAEISTHGPWQSVAMGFPATSKAVTSIFAFSLCRRKSGLTKPPGMTSAS